MPRLFTGVESAYQANQCDALFVLFQRIPVLIFEPIEACAESAREGHGHWIGISSAVRRSKPNAMLKHSTP